MQEYETIGEVPNAELILLKSNQVESMRLWCDQLEEMIQCTAVQRRNKWGKGINTDDLIYERNQVKQWIHANDPKITITHQRSSHPHYPIRFTESGSIRAQL